LPVNKNSEHTYETFGGLRYPALASLNRRTASINPLRGRGGGANSNGIILILQVFIEY